MSTMDMKKNRLRGPNFSSSESSLLCDIIVKHRHIIENKRTDGANLLQKQKAWVEVADEFNAVTSGHSRTVESLQQNYKNLKRKAKKCVSSAKMDIPVNRTALIQSIEEYGTSSDGWEKVADGTGASQEICKRTFITMTKEADKKYIYLKKNIMGTGGGPPPKHDDDPLLDKVKGLVGPSMEGLYTIYDGDSSIMELQNIPPIESQNLNDNEDIQMIQQKDEPPAQATLQSIIVTPKTHLSEDDLSSYFNNNRANLKRKPHDLLSRKRKLESHLPEKQSVSERFKVLASEKMEFLEMQKELLSLQLTKEKESLEHQRILWSMEIEDAKAKYAKEKESLEHQRMLWSMEIDDAKAKYAHNAELRKLNKEA